MPRYNPHQITRELEAAICEYTGAPFCVTTNSCTMALLLAVAWHTGKGKRRLLPRSASGEITQTELIEVQIPKRTYVSVPQAIMHAGGWPTYRDELWLGYYQLKPLPVWDSARWFSYGMYGAEGARFVPAALPFAHYGHGQFACVSFHTSKILADTQGGAILHDDPEADKWLRRARFDGRTEGFAPKDDTFDMIGWHCYMSPDVAARLLWKLSVLPKHNGPLPNDDYPDLSQMQVFR